MSGTIQKQLRIIKVHLVGQGRVGTWKNNMFDLLKSISWTFAATGKIQFPPATVTNIEGVICRDCSYAEISETGIEHYNAIKHLPTFIANLLPTDQFLDLTDFEILTNKPEVVTDREKLLTALTEYKINFTKNGSWLKSCPTCNSSNTCVYRWDVLSSDDKIILPRSKNNLTINADKTKTTWWKRLIGYN
jgi:hypothetical protein